MREIESSTLVVWTLIFYFRFQPADAFYCHVPTPLDWVGQFGNIKTAMHALTVCKLLESFVMLITIIIYHQNSPPTGQPNFPNLAHSVGMKGGREEEAETVIKWLLKHYLSFREDPLLLSRTITLKFYRNFLDLIPPLISFLFHPRLHS